MAQNDIISLIANIEVAKSKGITFSSLNTITLNQSDAFNFPASNLTKYIIYINISYTTPQNTVSFYDSTGTKVFSYNIKQPIAISLQYVNYTKIEFSEATTTANYEIGIFYSIVHFKNQEDYDSVMPLVDIKPNIADSATNAELIELQTLINDLNADTKTGLEGLTEIIEKQTEQLAFQNTTAAYGIYVNNFPSQTLTPEIAHITSTSTAIYSLGLPDIIHSLVIQNLNTTSSIYIGNSSVQPFILSPNGVFTWDYSDTNLTLDVSALVVNPNGNSLNIGVMYAW